MKSKKTWIAVLAVFTAVIGAVVAVGAFLKRKAKSLGDQLDYDGDLYLEEEEPESEDSDAPASDDGVSEDSAPKASE